MVHTGFLIFTYSPDPGRKSQSTSGFAFSPGCRSHQGGLHRSRYSFLVLLLGACSYRQVFHLSGYLFPVFNNSDDKEFFLQVWSSMLEFDVERGWLRRTLQLTLRSWNKFTAPASDGPKRLRLRNPALMHLPIHCVTVGGVLVPQYAILHIKRH